jgi:hypothetical protein
VGGETPSEEMDLRETYVRGAVTDFVREHRPALAQRLECSLGDVEVEGKDQTGFYSRVPWVRFADRRRSENLAGGLVRCLAVC